MAIEKQVFNMRFKNEEKYINGKSIAKLLQAILNAAHGNPEFYVAYQKDTATDKPAKYGGVLSCEIEPFSLRGTLAQTINIDYKCKVSTQNEAEHATVNKTLENILGPIDGTFDVSEDGTTVRYSFWSNFRYAKPFTPGELDGAAYYTTYNIKGYMHVIREGGARLSNEVKSYIKLDGVKYEVALRRGSTGVAFNVSNPLKANCFLAATEYISAGYAKSMAILYKDDIVCGLLRDFCEHIDGQNGGPFFNQETGKPEIVIVEEYPDRDIETTYYIVQLTCERESGAYMAFNLSLMHREETVITYDE